MSKEADREEIMDAFREVLDMFESDEFVKLKADPGWLKFELQKACRNVLRTAKEPASSIRC